MNSLQSIKEIKEIGVGLLGQVASDDFSISMGVVSSSHGLRRWLIKNDTVRALRRAILFGTITERAVRQFTDNLFIDFQRGTRFPHEIALSAIAVALENVNTEFASEYLNDLARLRVLEMPLAPRVAQICVSRHENLPKVKTREHRFHTSKRVTESRLERKSMVTFVTTACLLVAVVSVPSVQSTSHDFRAIMSNG